MLRHIPTKEGRKRGSLAAMLVLFCSDLITTISAAATRYNLSDCQLRIVYSFSFLIHGDTYSLLSIPRDVFARGIDGRCWSFLSFSSLPFCLSPTLTGRVDACVASLGKILFSCWKRIGSSRRCEDVVS